MKTILQRPSPTSPMVGVLNRWKWFYQLSNLNFIVIIFSLPYASCFTFSLMHNLIICSGFLRNKKNDWEFFGNFSCWTMEQIIITVLTNRENIYVLFLKTLENHKIHQLKKCIQPASIQRYDTTVILGSVALKVTMNLSF